jgi:quercetin dioxygenase-like cupin family protein
VNTPDLSGTFKPRDDSRRVEMLPGVFRQVLACGERAMVVKITLARGAVVPIHTHPHEQLGHVEQGLLRFTIGEESRDLGPFDGYVIPPHVPHGVVALEDDTIAIDTFAPPREEYHE